MRRMTQALGSLAAIDHVYEPPHRPQVNHYGSQSLYHEHFSTTLPEPLVTRFAISAHSTIQHHGHPFSGVSQRHEHNWVQAVNWRSTASHCESAMHAACIKCESVR